MQNNGKNNLLCIKKNFSYIIKEQIYYSEKNQTSFFKAIEVGTNRTVGIKQVCFKPAMRRSFESEIGMLMELEASTKDIPTVYFYNIDGNTLTIVMQYIPGNTLAAQLREDAPRLFERGMTVRNLKRLRALAEILGLVHQTKTAGGFVQHKDLKPQNIIVQKRGGRESVKLIDFGLSAGLPIRGSGTHGYQAPEQCEMFSGVEDTSRIDVFAFGLIMYEMLSGKRLQFGTDLILDKGTGKWLNIPEIENPSLPEGVNEILRKCLAYKPKERFANGGEIECQIRKIIPRN